MWNSRGSYRAALIASMLMLASLAWAGVGNFAPDVTFQGSSLNGWHVLGQADWRAQNGEIAGKAKPGSSGGWLVLDRSFQDLQFYSAFRCTGACKAGLLIRGEKTANGGMKGVFVSLAEGERASYSIVLDGQGKEIERKPLRQPPPGQMRFAPPAKPEDQARAGRGGGGSQPVSMPGGIPSPIERADTDLRPGQWNTIEIAMDVNMLRVFLNNGSGVQGGAADPEVGNYGPVALYAGEGDEVRFKDIAYKDLQTRAALTEELSPHFRMQAVNEFYYTWGPGIADINRDGVLDIVTGPYYYTGPDYNVAHEIYVEETLNPSTDYFNGPQFAYDFTGDGWPDVVNALTRPLVMYENPKGESRRWTEHVVTDRIQSELSLLKDVDGDGRLDFVFKSDDRMVYATPDPKNPTGKWIAHAVSEKGPWANHGVGVGDVNGDGRMDILNAFGWWEQPAQDAANKTWAYHPVAFGRWDRSSPGGGEIAVYDVNGDGLNDVVTSLQAHGWGLAWYEHKKDATGKISFVEHMIMDNFATKNAGGVTFSELHGAGFGDIDGDGIPDFVTGKRFWSHLDTFIDPDPHGPPVLYVYRTVRNPKAPGGAEFVPELVHNRSGMGSHVQLVDLNKDGALDIVTSTRRGTFIFWNQWKKTATTSRAAR